MIFDGKYFHADAAAFQLAMSLRLQKNVAGTEAFLIELGSGVGADEDLVRLTDLFDALGRIDGVADGCVVH